MKSKAEILHLLRHYKPTAQKKYGMTKIGIFGSVARDEQKEGSDVDVCYEGEAYAHQEDFTYPKNRRHFAWVKFLKQ